MPLTFQQRAARQWAKNHGLRAVETLINGFSLAPLLPESRTHLLDSRYNILLSNMVYFRGPSEIFRVIISHPYLSELEKSFGSHAAALHAAQLVATTAGLTVFDGAQSDNVWRTEKTVVPFIWFNPARVVSPLFEQRLLEDLEATA